MGQKKGDGGFKRRLHYLFMPFKFLSPKDFNGEEGVSLGNKARLGNLAIVQNLGLLLDEFFICWFPILKGYLEWNPVTHGTGDKIHPTPAMVLEHSESHFDDDKVKDLGKQSPMLSIWLRQSPRSHRVAPSFAIGKRMF